MTGFQVMDGDKHVFVLEGLRDRAIAYVWETVPAPENSGKAEWFTHLTVILPNYHNGKDKMLKCRTCTHGEIEHF